MQKVGVFSVLLVLGLLGSQVLPGLPGSAYAPVSEVIRVVTVVALAFIMIHVGYEFEIDKSNVRQYGWDYIVAMTAAAFPWIFVCLYFVFVMLPPNTWGSWQAWRECLLASRFAAPTSAGVLFAMLAAAGLSATWLFRKARVLAIFDDLDTVLLMIPLKMMNVGLAWQLGIVVVLMALFLWMAWQYLHRWKIPVSWPWVLAYSAIIGSSCELIYVGSKVIDYRVPVHMEVLLPAFVLGCMMARPARSDPHKDDPRVGHQEGPEQRTEQFVSTILSAVFMLLVGLSMPPLVGDASGAETPVSEASDGGNPEGRGLRNARTVTASQPTPGWGTLAMHVVLITVLFNVGKMFPALCYRAEAHWKARLALAVGLWPRGEVGAGVLILSLGYGIGGPIVAVAVLCLTLNLVLTGIFILIVQRLLLGVPESGVGDMTA